MPSARSRPPGPSSWRRTALFLALAAIVHVGGFYLWQLAVQHVFPWTGLGPLTSMALFPIAAAPLYTRLALGVRPTLLLSLLLALLVHATPPILPMIGLQTIAASLAGVLSLRSATGRGAVVLAGLWAGLASAAVLVLTNDFNLPIQSVIAGGVGAVLGGVLSGALALAFSPFIERLFGHVTPLTLVEALSYDHPLLRQLATKAPGTFLHSTNVAVICDAGARAIGADGLTTRVGALYHDVGKTRAPQDFIENQTATGTYRDLSVDDIREVLVDHVTEGVRLVLSHGLGERIADFVREHHGTSEMRSLIARAERSGTPASSPFRYPGPRPRSRETGLLMLADRVEATARARRPETPDECLALVREIVDQTVAEQQLVHSGLTDDELDLVEKVYAEVLHAVHHHRVGYREPADTPARLRAVPGRQA
ncbi:MAG: HDIG domain-containing protein [Vicinamibacterales bacterium]